VKTIIEARIVYRSISYTYIHSDLICSEIQVYDVMVEYNSFLCSIWTLPFNQAPPTISLDVKSGCASHLVYKLNKQIARCNNSQIKILNLFEFSHVVAT